MATNMYRIIVIILILLFVLGVGGTRHAEPQKAELSVPVRVVYPPGTQLQHKCAQERRVGRKNKNGVSEGEG